VQICRNIEKKEHIDNMQSAALLGRARLIQHVYRDS
jgi:hypothetical protein